MWMVGYNDSSEVNMADHSFNGRKLRPLIPRPVTSSNNTSTAATPCLSTDFFSQYHNLTTMAEQSKREFNTPPVVVSSRWNPTPEQLRALEELYRRGTRTPSAEEIQHITAQLRRFGKIEGKNVFYWFQNHKARERQKRRRQIESAADGRPRDFDSPEKEGLGANRTVFEVEETKNWAPSTNCSTVGEESVSIQRAAKAAIAACRADGWIQLDEGELQQRRNLMERNATWRMMQLSCPPPAASPHLVNTPPTTFTTTIAAAARAIDPKLIKKHDLNFIVSPRRENAVIHLNCNNEENDSCGEAQTLQLFPLRSGEDSDDLNRKERESVSAMNANFNRSQFFEFLPLKN